ncbi:MAG: aldehyde dehydrogenase family protein [Myxococcota bacterium]
MQTFRRRAEYLADRWRERPPHLFVGGLDVEAESHTSVPVVDPSTGTSLGRCPSGSPRDVERGVRAAPRAANGPLQALTPDRRRDLIARVARLLEGDQEDLMILHALETGRPVRHVRSADVEPAILSLRYAAGWCGKLDAPFLDLGAGLEGTVRRSPIPVVGLGCDDRHPLRTLAGPVAAALAAGSALVVQVPDTVPLALFRLAELVHEAGFPPGTLNVVPGRGPALEALAQHPQIGLLAHQGSVETGRRLLVLAAKSNLKPVDLLLGGKTTAVVFDDGSLRKASRQAVQQGLFARGADVDGLQRMLVHRSVYEEVASLMAHHAKGVVVSDPMDEHTELGALATEARMKQVLAYCSLGRREGASLVAGGSRHVDGPAAHGTFVAPSLFVEARPNMRIFREDCEGPMIVMAPFDDDEEALSALDGLDLGLGVSIWSEDPARLKRFTRGLASGLVWHNSHGARHPALLQTTRGLSGNFVQGGRSGIERFTHTATVVSEEH